MAVQLITVARFIAGSGVGAAITKYGKRLVDAAKKEYKDLTSKRTSGQEKVRPATRGQRAFREGRRQGAGAGAVAGFGAGATTAGDGESKNKKKLSDKTKKMLSTTPKGKVMSEKKLSKGGALKKAPAEAKGLKKLPTEVRNKMGYMYKGGKATKFKPCAGCTSPKTCAKQGCKKKRSK